MRGGLLYVNVGHLSVAGIHGYDWSLTATSKRFDDLSGPSAYYFAFADASAIPSAGSNYRWLAFPLHC